VGHILGLGYVLPQDHVRTATQSLFQFNHQVGFNPADEAPRKFMDERDSGLWVCRWPNGGMPPSPILYNAECWSGVEYPVASLSYFEGLTKQGFTIVDDVRARQDGTRRSPWNEVECGDHYSRPQAAWALLDAATGYHYNAPKRSLSFAPVISRSNFTCFFITESGWGTYKQSGPNDSLSSGTISLSIAYGQAVVKQLVLVTAANKAVVSLNAQVVGSSAKTSGGKMTIDLAVSARVTDTITLRVSLS